MKLSIAKNWDGNKYFAYHMNPLSYLLTDGSIVRYGLRVGDFDIKMCNSTRELLGFLKNIILLKFLREKMISVI